MKNDDAQLIQRVLDGDDTAFSALVKKISVLRSCTGVAKNRRLSHRRGDYTGYIPESVSETLYTEGATILCELALCHN